MNAFGRQRGWVGGAMPLLAAAWLSLAAAPCLAHMPATPADPSPCRSHAPEVVDAGCELDCNPFERALTDTADPPKPAPALAEVPAPLVDIDTARDPVFAHLRPESTGPPFTERFCCFLE